MPACVAGIKREKGKGVWERRERFFPFSPLAFRLPYPSKFSSRHRKRSAFAWEITRTILKVLKGKMRNTMLSRLRASRDIFHYLRKLLGQRVDLTTDIEHLFLVKSYTSLDNCYSSVFGLSHTKGHRYYFLKNLFVLFDRF